MASPNEIVLTSGPLRLCFKKIDDRYTHELRVLDAGSETGERVLLSSVEGTASDKWPSSPPFQELHVEDRGAEQVALLVGMAGSGHWSGAIETLPNAGFSFDMACKTSHYPDRLGGTYRFSGPEIDGLKIELLNGSEDGTSLDFAEELLNIQVKRPMAGTKRWRYRIST